MAHIRGGVKLRAPVERAMEEEEEEKSGWEALRNSMVDRRAIMNLHHESDSTGSEWD